MIFLDAVRSQNMPHAFQDVIRDEAGLQPRCSLKAFRAFAAAQLAEENIDFLVEVRMLARFCFPVASSPLAFHPSVPLSNPFKTVVTRRRALNSDE